MDDIIELSLEGCDGDFELFCDECYKFYSSIWLKNPRFNNKPIYRDSRLDNNKEMSFWGLVEGHNDNKQFKYLERYKTIPYFHYILTNLNNTENNNNSDIIWLVQQKRTTVISKRYNYFLRLNETTKITRLITGYPINQKKKVKIVKEWLEYWEEIQNNQGR